MSRLFDVLSGRDALSRSHDRRGWIGGRACARASLLVTALFAALPASAGAASWSIQATPNAVTGPNSFNELLGVSCPAASDCTAVGWDGDSSTIATLAERWDGTSWVIQPTPNPAGGTTSHPILNDVSCTSASACTAVGDYDVPAANLIATLVERWDGTSWTIQPSPNTAASNSGNVLAGVSCTSSSACVAVGVRVGSSGLFQALAERWDGSTWTIQSVPTPPGADSSDFMDVSCTSATACTAVGQFETDEALVNDTAELVFPLVERWNGKRWTVQQTLSPASPASLGAAVSTPPFCFFTGPICVDVTSFTRFTGASCTSASACTAVGNYAPVLGHGLTLAERWNGLLWLTQSTPTPNGGGFLSGVSCTSANACTAIGDSGSFPELPFAESWNGMKWSIQTTPTPAGTNGSPLIRVSCTSAAACTAVGYSENTTTDSNATLAEHYS